MCIVCLLYTSETLEVGVAGDIRHLLHDDDRVIPECERAFEVVSVSYTHLDVYKRQVQGGVLEVV